MRKPNTYIEIFLQPGEFYFGDAPTRIRTVLGSCVAITMWHPRLCVGGMCHYLLPSRKGAATGQLDGRYGDEAFRMFINETKRHHTDPKQYEIKLFGGGDMFPGLRSKDVEKIGTQNVSSALGLFEACGCKIKSRHVGGKGHRTVIMDVWSGDVWVKHYPETM